MEQYWMPKELDFENLRFCLDHYAADYLFIRLTGSSGGTNKVNENLEDKTLDFRKDKSGLYLLVDSSEVFHFAYERVQPTEDGIGRMVILGYGIDPYDTTLPEPRRSFLRTVLDNHLMEIFFKGRVDIKFHSWWDKPHWKYWTVDESSFL